MDEAEFCRRARGFLIAVRPLVPGHWDVFIDSGLRSGEYTIAIDDAMQGMAEAKTPLPVALRKDLDLILAELPRDDVDYRRITMWLAKVPAA